MDASRIVSITPAKGEKFPWREADAYLFDIDGTLLNTRDLTHYYAFHRAMLEVFGVSCTIDGLVLHGNTDMGIIRAALRREGLSDGEISEKLPTALQYMCDEVARNAAGLEAEVCPSIREFLDDRLRQGKLLGVVSGNLEPIGWLKIEAAGLRSYFAFGCFSGRRELREDIFRDGMAESRRRIGNQAKVCFVGDTPADIQAAQAVGAPIIAVATGIYKPEDLFSHGPDVCVSCCRDLLSAG